MEAVSNGNQLITHFKSMIMKGTEVFKRTIGEYLQVRANTDEIFAQRMKKEGKTLDGCVDFILNTVKESGCNGFEDDEINRQADSKRRKEQEKAEELARIRRERYNIRMEERRAQKAKEKAEREKAAVLYYPARRKKFFGMIIAGQGIEIRVLQSVSEFMEEGLAMHHCVFANEYYDVRKKPNCLILSAKKDGERVETVEVDMSDYHVVQSRGKHNQHTPYHDTIMKLMNDNMGMIKDINNKNRRVI